MNDLCEASAIANRKYTQPAHKKRKYTTITTSRRNKNSEQILMCECTNENNTKKILVLFFSPFDEKEKANRRYI